MDKPYLSWIDNESLERVVKSVYDKFIIGLRNKTLKEFESNIIDPFSAMFEMYSAQSTPLDWLKNEVQRQAQKSMTNEIGDFHEQILGACDSWIYLPKGHETGIDVMKADGSIYAELKNKHNTIKGDSNRDFLDRYIALATNNPDATIYLVHIIHKGTNKKYGDKDGKVWTVSKNSHPRVKLIRGRDFYHLVTRDPNALRDLFIVLPKVIKKIVTEQKVTTENAPIFKALETKFKQQNLPISEDNLLEYFFKQAFD